MTTYTLRVFGLAVLSLEIDRGDPDPPPSGISGGGTHDFERDFERDVEERALGFRA